MDNMETRWSVNESLLQSYRSIFISSQSFLIAVGAILLDAKTPVWLLALIAGLALLMIWYLWFRVVVSRHRAVDYYKFQIDKKTPENFFNCCTEREYISNSLKRTSINCALQKKNWRPTRIKVDFLLPLIFTSIWLALFIARLRSA